MRIRWRWDIYVCAELKKYLLFNDIAVNYRYVYVSMVLFLFWNFKRKSSIHKKWEKKLIKKNNKHVKIEIKKIKNK